MSKVPCEYFCEVNSVTTEWKYPNKDQLCLLARLKFSFASKAGLASGLGNLSTERAPREKNMCTHCQLLSITDHKTLEINIPTEVNLMFYAFVLLQTDKRASAIRKGMILLRKPSDCKDGGCFKPHLPFGLVSETGSSSGTHLAEHRGQQAAERKQHAEQERGLEMSPQKHENNKPIAPMWYACILQLFF